MMTRTKSEFHQHNQAALKHLQSLSPRDGYTIGLQSSSDGNEICAILRRRNVPLNPVHSRFLCIYHDAAASGHVVGITRVTQDGQDYVCSDACILVDSNGKVCSGNERIRVVLVLSDDSNQSNDDNNNNNNRSSHTDTNNSSVWLNQAFLWTQQMSSTLQPMIQNAVTTIQTNFSNASMNATPNNTQSNNSMMNAPNNNDLFAYAFLFVFAAVIMKVIVAILMSFAFMLLPVGVVLYCTCPSPTDFDAKKELKRVLRGAHLPEDHPEKPKGWLEKTAAKITASVTAELVTAAGYEVQMTSFGGLANLARVDVPSSNVMLYYIGCLNRWTYIMQRPIER